MRVVRAAGPDIVEVAEVTSPALKSPTDAVVSVTASAICGADLLPLSGHVPGFEWGTVLGHEFVGTVAEAGADVPFAVGSRVVCSSTVSCGTCWYCRHAMSSQCEQMALFGFSGVYPRLDGGQADLVRVPHADRVLWPLPEALDDDAAVFIADILPTAVRTVERAEVAEGDSVVVLGAGPVGLLEGLLADASGAHVVMVDPERRRRVEGERLGLRAVGTDEVLGVIEEMTTGRGVDVAIEASGHPDALASALAIVRGRGVVSVSGAHFDPDRPVDVGRMFAKELSLRFAMGSPTDDRARVAEMVLSGRIDPRPLITHRFPLDAAAEAYRIFRTHEATKVVLQP
jgi:2-desacetyl-2-hydroxyethyl bacteriochlorophyllide A dehydrogenase